MRLLILGASGGCGRWLVKLAVDKGHDVTALVRPSTPVDPPSQVVVRRGNALAASDISEAFVNHDAVISCIGSQRINPRNPWSPLKPPLGVAESCCRILSEVLPAGTRVITISAAGVGDSFGRTNLAMRWMLRHSSVGQMYADLDRMEQVLRESRLDWMAIRPVTLINAAPSSRTKVLQRFRVHSCVARADVAAWLLNSAQEAHIAGNRTPMIGWW